MKKPNKTNQNSKQQNIGEDYKKIIQEVREYIFRNHRFPSISQISESTRISVGKCKDLCLQLVRQKQLYMVFGGGRGLPIILLPYNMMQAILRTQAKPNWITDHGFTESEELYRKIAKLNKEINRYEMFERLLYTEDIPLEEAVAFTLDWLGFKNVVHYKDNPDNPDITFEDNGRLVLMEIEGTTKAGDKRKILQLDGWMTREINKGKARKELDGIFVVNHHRENAPDKRNDPLTKHAREFLKHYSFRFFTTPFLFSIISSIVEGKLTKKEARKVVLKGEKNE